MTLRVFIASIQTETNSFSPLPTGRAGFVEMGSSFGDSAPVGIPGRIADVMRRIVGNGGHEAIESVFAFAQPGGLTLDTVHCELRDRLLADLRAAMPVDVVFLWLHGAMMAVSEPDCEGDLLARVRAIVGEDVPVGAVLDPHCHLTDRMLEAADALVCMKEYPHTDGQQRAVELMRILERSARKEVRPVMAMTDTRMIGFYPTTTEPMAGLVRLQKELETRDRVLSVSLVHGFPWADLPEVGTRALAVVDGDCTVANAVAGKLADAVYAERDELRNHFLDVDVALMRAAEAPGLTVIADVADNPGGGAPGDHTVLLRALIDRGPRPSAIGAIYDPQAVAICKDAGVGAHFLLRIGGKLGPSSGDPFDAMVTVCAMIEQFQPRDMSMQMMGDCVRLEVAGVHVVLCSRRAQTFSPQVFEALGLEMCDLAAIAVKSSQHFHAAFAPIASEILYVSAGGALDMAFDQFQYRRRSLDYWPRIADPRGGAPV